VYDQSGLGCVNSGNVLDVYFAPSDLVQATVHNRNDVNGYCNHLPGAPHCSSRLGKDGWEVFYLTDPAGKNNPSDAAWTSCYSSTASTEDVFVIDVPCTAPYAIGVRIRQYNTDTMNLAEVFVYGTRLPEPAPPPSPRPHLDVTGCFMHGVGSGGGSESESCSRCHDEGIQQGFPHEHPQYGDSTTCALWNGEFGANGAIIDLYFAPSHISAVTVHLIHHGGWEALLGFNGWKVFYATTVAGHNSVTNYDGAESFVHWVQCFEDIPIYDQNGNLLPTSDALNHDNVNRVTTGGQSSVTADCLGDNAVGIRVWQRNHGNLHGAFMFLKEVDVFGDRIYPPAIPEPPSPPPHPPRPPPYSPGKAPLPPPLPPMVTITDCFMSRVGTVGHYQNYVNPNHCSNCHNGILTDSCYDATGSNGGLLDMYFEPADISDVEVQFSGLSHGLEARLGQEGWKVLYTTTTDAYDVDGFDGDTDWDTSSPNPTAPSLRTHEGFGSNWAVCYEVFPEFDSGDPWGNNPYPFSSPRFRRDMTLTGGKTSVRVPCEAKNVVGIRIWQLSGPHAGSFQFADVNVYGTKLPPSPPAPPPPPSPPWDYAFGQPNLQPCSKQFDYVLVMQWSVGGPHTGGRDGLAGANSEADIKAVAGAWIRKFVHGSSFARGGILMLYNGGAEWATEWPQTSQSSIMTEFSQWLTDHPKVAQSPGTDVVGALYKINAKFPGSVNSHQAIYMFHFDYGSDVGAVNTAMVHAKSNYHVYGWSFGDIMGSAYVPNSWWDVGSSGWQEGSGSYCGSIPCIEGYDEWALQAVVRNAAEECVGNPICSRSSVTAHCALPPPPPAPPRSRYLVVMDTRCATYVGYGGGNGMYEYKWPSNSNYQACCDSNGNAISGSQSLEQLQTNCEAACASHFGSGGRCNIVSYWQDTYCNLGTYPHDFVNLANDISNYCGSNSGMAMTHDMHFLQ
tara:strand:- start:144 stop:3002 length:2859 start_codon:yes stop_codon:yes gene_type:complete